MDGEYKQGWVEQTHVIDGQEVMIDINPDGTIADIYAYKDGKPFLEGQHGKQFKKVKWVRGKHNKLFIHVAPDQLRRVYDYLLENDYLQDIDEDELDKGGQ